MTISQASARLTTLGFSMNPTGANLINFGTMEAETFVHPGVHILSTPRRDVYIGKCKGGWYITSTIHFKAHKRRARIYNTFDARRLNIFGGGSTLEMAMMEFESNFRTKTYNVSV